MAVVVDDRLLLDVLAGRAAPEVMTELDVGRAFSTGTWYYRLGRASVEGSGSGALSGRLRDIAQSRAPTW